MSSTEEIQDTAVASEEEPVVMAEKAAMDIEENCSDVKSSMKAKKQSDSYGLAEDVYAFIFVAPVFSTPFLFSAYVVLTKLVCYAILLSDIGWAGVESYSTRSTAVKFFLVPVAVAMQEDLIRSFSAAANIVYDPKVLEIHKSATKAKYAISAFLRTFDGVLSLVVNFYVMLTTVEVLSVFLNFAALQFLQSIDDIFYELATLGFFGDKMEHWATLCTKVQFPRRQGDKDKNLCGRLKISHLDSVLFGITSLVCYVVYAICMIGVRQWFDANPAASSP